MNILFYYISLTHSLDKYRKNIAYNMYKITKKDFKSISSEFVFVVKAALFIV